MNEPNRQDPLAGPPAVSQAGDPAARLLALVSGTATATTESAHLVDPLTDHGLAEACFQAVADGGQVGSVDVEPPHPLVAAVAEFGRDEAAVGSRPPDVARAVEAAARQLGSGGRQRLDVLSLQQVALAAWAEEQERLANRDQCVDIRTGLHTGAYLRTRIVQLYAQSTALGVRSSSLWSLLTVRLQRRPTLAAIVELDAVARQVRAVFTSGETVAVVDGACCVALSPVHAVGDRVVTLELALATDPALAHATWTVTPQPLPDDLADALASIDQIAIVPPHDLGPPVPPPR
ncbi:MAG TPA: hypothetical protein VHA73_13465 [Acidimicrobiales bacterium]|nr:hypothetical protein [Acidimicrobiales bacterium]